MKIQSPAITMAKQLLGISGDLENELLLLYGNIVESEAIVYTKNLDVLFENELLAQMIAAKYKTKDTQGLASQSLATVSETYVLGYPQSISIALRGFRKLIIL